MNKKLQKQIKVYAGVAGAILSAEKLNAQVVYADVNPDTTIALTSTCCSVGIHIDMDNDFIDDLVIAATGNGPSTTSLTGSAVRIWPLVQTKILQDTIQPIYPMALQNGANIGYVGNWLYNGLLLGYLAGSHSVGNWFVGDDKCVGIRLLISGQVHFGWIHLEIVGPKAFKLKDYAYQLQPGVSMLACDTTNLATNISENNPQFNFSQQNNTIHISSFQKLNHAIISVYDLPGKKILQQPFDGKETTIKIDKKGIYLVEVKSEKRIFRKKIFIY